MQTFLPLPDFADSAAILDRQRLGKQRVECVQLIRAAFAGGGWSRHPATRMWKKHIPALCAYGVAICDEWIRRGYQDTCRDKIRYLWAAVLVHDPYNLRHWPGDVVEQPYSVPPWLGREDFHASHRSNLLRKDPTWYSRFGWTEENDLPYVWPV